LQISQFSKEIFHSYHTITIITTQLARKVWEIKMYDLQAIQVCEKTINKCIS